MPRSDPERRIIRVICERHGLEPAGAWYPDGSCPVFAVGDAHVIKLFAPHDQPYFATERRVLRHIHGALAIPTPAVHEVGEVDGWRYLLMEQLRGQDLRRAWPRIPRDQLLRLATELGRALAQLHALATAPLADLEPRWAEFVAAQRQSGVARQRAHGLDERWLAQIEPFLGAVELGRHADAALLHTEIMREHVLVTEHGGAWRLSGLIDFEPAMLGHPEYELASVGLFLAEGDRDILRAVLLGYGWAPADITPALEQRLMVYTLLHRYSKLPWYLERMPPAPGVTTLHDLARQWFACA